MKYGYKHSTSGGIPVLIASEHVTGDSFWSGFRNGCPIDMIGRSAYRVHETPEAALEFVLASLERQARDIQAHADSVRSHIAALKAGISAEDFYMSEYSRNLLQEESIVSEPPQPTRRSSEIASGVRNIPAGAVDYELIKKEVVLRREVIAMAIRIHEFLVEAGHDSATLNVENLGQLTFRMGKT